MACTKQEIRNWLAEAKNKGATHVIVLCDTFRHEDYPVFVMPGKSARQSVDEYKAQKMRQVMEVYNLNMSIEDQLSAYRAFNF